MSTTNSQKLYEEPMYPMNSQFQNTYLAIQPQEGQHTKANYISRPPQEKLTNITKELIIKITFKRKKQCQ